MAFFDLPEAELRRYRPTVTEPEDFDDFWTGTIATARQVPIQSSVVTAVPAPFAHIRVFDVRFPGFGGHPVGAWLLVPDGAERCRAIVHFQGYGGGRGLPHEWLPWASAGYVTLVVDTRGQGAHRDSGSGTPDPAGSEPAVPGFMTRGILHRDTYYYRRVYTDAVRAIDFLQTRTEVDAGRVAVAGISQGGGIAIAASALHGAVAACLADVPFLCHFERAVGLTDSDPYAEIVRYLRAHRDDVAVVASTLAYFDGVSLAARATAPTLFSVALQDTVCPPSTVFAAFNAWDARRKEIVVWPLNGHEGGGADQWPRQVKFLAESLRAASEG
ncbi:acetylxylan esterase [Microbacterium lacus]|uniref:Acetylxylan esterase n=1 Tax=Microbacterium lacus TaxID=415217 RepID=A0ABP4TEB7_9MICO